MREGKNLSSKVFSFSRSSFSKPIRAALIQLVRKTDHENVAQENEKAISRAIKIDEKEIRTHLDGLVRQSVEDTLNALLNAETDAMSKNP